MAEAQCPHTCRANALSPWVTFDPVDHNEVLARGWSGGQTDPPRSDASSRPRTSTTPLHWRLARSPSSRGRLPTSRTSSRRSRGGCPWCRATGSDCDGCRSTSSRRRGSTTRTSTSAGMSATPPFPPLADASEIERLLSRVMSQANGPQPPVVGVLVLRRSGRRALGAAVQASPQHGRRGLGLRPLPPAPRPVAQSQPGRAGQLGAGPPNLPHRPSQLAPCSSWRDRRCTQSRRRHGPSRYPASCSVRRLPRHRVCSTSREPRARCTPHH